MVFGLKIKIKDKLYILQLLYLNDYIWQKKCQKEPKNDEKSHHVALFIFDRHNIQQTPKWFLA
jgi:hypothetical protein